MDQVLVLLQMGMYINPRIFKPFYEDLHEIEHEEMSNKNFLNRDYK